MTDWNPPLCIHGHIILMCPDPHCLTQNAYLDQHYAALHEDRQGQWEAILHYAETMLEELND